MSEDMTTQPSPQEFLLAMHKEETDQARQHEVLRRQSAALVLTLLGAILAAVTATAPEAITALAAIRAPWFFCLYGLLGAFIIALGSLGRKFSLKHYERHQYHSVRAGTYRAHLEKLFPNSGYDTVDKNAPQKHKEVWLSTFPNRPDLLLPGTYALWMRLYDFVIASGIALIFLSVMISAIAAFYWP